MGRTRRSRWHVAGLDLMSIGHQCYDGHQSLIDRGWALGGNSGVWRRKDGSFTVRLVYRKESTSVTVNCRMVRG